MCIKNLCVSILTKIRTQVFITFCIEIKSIRVTYLYDCITVGFNFSNREHFLKNVN